MAHLARGASWESCLTELGELWCACDTPQHSSELKNCVAVLDHLLSSGAGLSSSSSPRLLPCQPLPCENILWDTRQVLELWWIFSFSPHSTALEVYFHIVWIIFLAEATTYLRLSLFSSHSQGSVNQWALKKKVDWYEVLSASAGLQDFSQNWFIPLVSYL